MVTHLPEGLQSEVQFLSNSPDREDASETAGGLNRHLALSVSPLLDRFTQRTAYRALSCHSRSRGEDCPRSGRE